MNKPKRWMEYQTLSVSYFIQLLVISRCSNHSVSFRVWFLYCFIWINCNHKCLFACCVWSQWLHFFSSLASVSYMNLCRFSCSRKLMPQAMPNICAHESNIWDWLDSNSSGEHIYLCFFWQWFLSSTDRSERRDGEGRRRLHPHQ